MLNQIYDELCAVGMDIGGDKELMAEGWQLLIRIAKASCHLYEHPLEVVPSLWLYDDHAMTPCRSYSLAEIPYFRGRRLPRCFGERILTLYPLHKDSHHLRCVIHHDCLEGIVDQELVVFSWKLKIHFASLHIEGAKGIRRYRDVMLEQWERLEEH
ncbi:MAG: hypothetical protein K0S20_605 [Patescibacteria group bacterium]|jgi:hypothetical protein|nr:hypothetical protein [Patescibacteria group bacterium]